MTKRLTPEQRLARAEAKAEMLAEQLTSSRLQASQHLDRINTLLDEQEAAEKELVDIRATHRAELKRAEENAANAFKIVDTMKAEANQLRGMVRDAELTNERYRGYLDGLEDSKPPVMVPERREPRRASYPDSGERIGSYDPMAVIGSRHPNGPKPWWYK